ncbi:hypothetical protein EI77_00790 [Prosthecobacter fusiformis]|uniref:Uncharacterized protein n=1 Tax=Prosthecobacter fusiformis TaxID=48464 RepID=A0A4R7SQY4_9BACT|nr:hypothetical protein [Prosthecobacter fusiformis]TDU81481.1 hypothetical protein EI77_00790 [Prosthecobacter fusiformis]
MHRLFWPLVYLMSILSAEALPLRPSEQRLMVVPAIPMEPGVPTERDYLAQEKAWGQRRLLAPAQERWKEQPWGPKATTLVERSLELKAAGSVLPHPLAPLAADFRALIQEGADDPLILTLAAQAFYAENQDWRVGKELLERVLNLSGLPTAVEVMALRTQIPQLMQEGAEYRYVRGRLVDVMIRAISDGTYDAEADAVMVRHQIAVLDLVGVTMPSYLARWQETVAGSEWPDWVKWTLQGYGEIELAWLERSSDWAATVKDEQWEGFAAHLKIAREHLVKAWEARADRPEAAGLMVTVTMGDSGGDDELRLWFDRSVKAQFDYQAAYNNLLWAYRPRWCGSHELMLAFGRACIETGRFDTGVPSQMFYAAMDVASEENDAFEVYQREGVRDPVLAMAKGYAEVQGLPAGLQQLRRSNAALAAWLGGDATLASRLLAEAGELHFCTLNFMNQMLLSEPQLRGEVAARSGQYGPEVQALAMLPRSPAGGEHENALKALAGKELSADAQAYVQERRDYAEFLPKLATGEWVSVTPRKHLTSFMQTGGRWSAEADGTLVAAGDDSRWAVLALDLPFTHDVEMRYEMTLEDPKQVEVSPLGWGSAALLRWSPKMVGDPEDGVRCMVSSGPQGVVGQAYRTKPEKGTSPVAVTLGDVNQVLARITTGALHFEFNDVKVADGVSLEELGIYRPEGRIGFGVSRLPSGTKLKIRNIQVRKL